MRSFVVSVLLAATVAGEPAIEDLSAIKLDSKVVESNLIVDANPLDIAMTPDGATAWVTMFTGSKISEIQRRKVTRTMDIPGSPTGIALSADGKTLYVGLAYTQALALVDVEKMTVRKTVPMCAFPIGVRVSPDGKFVGVACQGSGELAIVSTAKLESKDADSAVMKIAVGSMPYYLAFAPDSKRVWVPAHGGNTLAVVDLAMDGTPALTGSVPVGANPVGVAVSKERGTVWVANWGSATVTQVHPKTLEVVATHKVGTNPYWVASSAACDCMLVSNFGAPTLDVLYEGRTRTRIKVEDSIINVYPSPDGKRLFATSWSHASVKIIE